MAVKEIKDNMLECVSDAMFQNLIFALPHAGQEECTEVYRSAPALVKCSVEPVGRWYEAVISRRTSKQSAVSFNSVESGSSSEDDDDNSQKEETPEEVAYLRSLDPKDWKSQDHYDVFGLKQLRYKATDEDIKKAYRRKVLRHHPDKRRNAGEIVQDLDHDYFSCITRAYEILGNHTKRRSYDSVDPEFDNDIPSCNSQAKEKFFQIFAPVFERNSRWSIEQPVPSLGNDKSSVEDVDLFYKFWYDFDSWREFSYMDEEEKERGENREERKWIEKQNKVARQKLKKEEMARIRQLVDTSYACDPRIQRFKDEEKQRKLAQKKAKQDAVRAKAEEEEKKRMELLEAAKKAKEEEEVQAKAQREKEKKEKEAHKKLLKKEKKLLQQLCSNHGHFAEGDDQKIIRLQEMDLLCRLLSLQKLQSLNECLQESDKEKCRSAFMEEVTSVQQQLQKEKEDCLSSVHKSTSSSSNSAGSGQKQWNHDDIQLLVKAVNVFPAGTANRWEVVAAYIMQHSTTGIPRTAKEVLSKAKDMQKLDTNLKEEVNKKAYEKLEKTQKVGTVQIKDESAPSERFDTPAEQQGVNLAPWTAEEQRLLEQALKTYQTTVADRWERIAECLPGRSKKDCMRRYKDLVELVKAKKAAQAAAANLKGKK